MFRTRYLLPSLFIVSAIIVGCSKPQSSSALLPNPADRSVEAKATRLEADLKKANEEIAKLAAQTRLDASKIKAIESEREELKINLKDRISERDIAAGKLDSFRKNVKELLGQLDAAVATPFQPIPEVVTILPPPVVPNGPGIPLAE